ncbi:MATE family efflux transporter [Sporofaciens sp. SGI.106]|uniref:MATE family efflux transporter n=1 Tax=Sporofaciens sp. SGI.106 TaxID=3420568 RepID=UPI002A98CDD3|nr:MATE family efflux transporter [Lachnoclostridium sp.]
MKLEGKSLKSDFMRFIVPSIVAQWVFALYTMVDGIFVAKGVSEVALTAVNIVMPYIMALYAISILFAVGTSTVVAILLGEKNGKRANEVFTQNITLLTIFSVLITIIVMLNLKSVALFLGATEVNMKYVLEYLRAIVPFSGLFILSYSFETLIKTDGYPKMATFIVTAGSVLNVILDYFMVMRWHMGIGGAALATGISHVVLIAMYLVHFCGKKGTIKFRRFRWDIPVIWREVKNGIPSGITELSTGLIIFLFNQAILKFLNEDALVSYTIISYVNSIAVMTMVGIAQGYQPLISYYFGQKRMDRCKKLLRYGIVAVIVASIAFTGGCLLGADGIVGLFLEKNMTELFAYSSGVLRIFALSFLIAGYNIVIGGYFTAVEEPVSATIISMGRSIVMLILSLGLLTMVFGGAGIWWSPLLAEALTLVFTLVFFFRYLKRINA